MSDPENEISENEISESESSDSESSDSYWDNEISNRNYKRQLCITMLFDDLIFGHDINSSKDIFNHYMLMSATKPEFFFDNSYKQHVDMLNRETLKSFRRHHYPIMPHIRIKNGEYKICSLEIAKPLMLGRGEFVCIHYTFWIRIFIRTAIKFIKNKKKAIRSILSGKRERTGRIY